MLAGLLAGCYETRTTVYVQPKFEDTYMIHEHYVWLDAVDNDADAAREYIEDLYDTSGGQAQASDISKDGYVGKRYRVGGAGSEISRLGLKSGGYVYQTKVSDDSARESRLVGISRLELEGPPSRDGYRPSTFTVLFPDGWVPVVQSAGGGRVVRTEQGITFVAPDSGVWRPSITVNLPKPEIVENNPSSPDIRVLDGEDETPELEVLEPDLPEYDVIEPQAGDQDAPNPPAGAQGNDPGGVDLGGGADPAGGLPGDFGTDFDDFYGADSGGTPTEVDADDFFGSDSAGVPTVDGGDGSSVTSAGQSVAGTSSGPGLLGGVFTGLAVGGLLAGLVILLARRKREPVVDAE